MYIKKNDLNKSDKFVLIDNELDNKNILISNIKFATKTSSLLNIQNKLNDLSQAAIDQIKEKQYDTKLKEKYNTIIYYGIAFCEKRCCVNSEIIKND